MVLDTASVRKPYERLANALADDLAGMDALIRARMANAHVPRIADMTAHLIGAGGKRVRPMLTLACARMFADAGPSAH